MTWLTHTTSSLYDAALALVYPQACAVCHAHVESRADGVACARCWETTRVFSGAETMCWKCGALAGGTVAEEERTMVRCRRCDVEAFTAARACGVYEGALRASVLALKREAHVPARLARLMYEAQQRAPLALATRIVPVPLHPERARERGFNQAAVLAASLARRTGLPLDDGSLVRTLHTERHRAGMDARARRESVQEAFSVERPRLVRGERILLVDDVFTTGATASSCACALKAAGAQAVFVLTVARP
ncbi:MAG TPA: ComF family protein [Pyrinomonadaceae bacterium]|jgi:ComF family protein